MVVTSYLIWFAPEHQKQVLSHCEQSGASVHLGDDGASAILVCEKDTDAHMELFQKDLETNPHIQCISLVFVSHASQQEEV